MRYLTLEHETLTRSANATSTDNAKLSKELYSAQAIANIYNNNNNNNIYLRSSTVHRQSLIQRRLAINGHGTCLHTCLGTQERERALQERLKVSLACHRAWWIND